MGFQMQPYGVQAMLKEGHKHLSGVDEAVLKNIDACKHLSTITRTSLRPNGMNKMVINHLDKLFVTNDAATIVNELELLQNAEELIRMGLHPSEIISGYRKAINKVSAKEKSGKGKAKREPSREEMLAVVGDILKEVDFNTATLSDILRQLGDHFKMDLMHKKVEVKSIIEEVINNMTDDEEDGEEENADGANEDPEEDGDKDGDD